MRNALQFEPPKSAATGVVSWIAVPVAILGLVATVVTTFPAEAGGNSGAKSAYGRSAPAKITPKFNRAAGKQALPKSRGAHASGKGKKNDLPRLKKPKQELKIKGPFWKPPGI